MDWTGYCVVSLWLLMTSLVWSSSCGLTLDVSVGVVDGRDELVIDVVAVHHYININQSINQSIIY